jgi:Uma2 family endonuclease
MITNLRPLTIADWDAIPYDEWNRYEIIEGELFVSCSPGLTHQMVLGNLFGSIVIFLKTNPIGTIVTNQGLILSNLSGVIPDLIFFSREQRNTIVKDDRLHGPPALVIEIVSPGSTNIRRDRIVKLQLYAKHGIPEYWVIDPQNLTVERYLNQGACLILEETLRDEQILSTSALPGWSCPLSEIFQQF